MPFQSQAQNRWAHSAAGTRALGGPSKVKEWEKATDYSGLPEKKGTNMKPGGNSTVSPGASKGAGPQAASFAAGGAVGAGDTRWTKKDPQGRSEYGQFLGTSDRFTDGRKPAGYPGEAKTDENWGKASGVGHTDSDDSGDSKSLTPVKPHK